MFTGFSGALDPPVDKDGWQRHLEEGGSNNNFTWNSPSNSNSKQVTIVLGILSSDNQKTLE